MPKGRYLLALVCYLAIPAVVIGGAAVFAAIDPEWARGHADYVERFRWLERVRTGMLMATAGLALLLWIACCALLLTARARSRRWLALAAAGPLGFSVIAALADLAPAPGDRYQRFVGGLKTHRRVPFELAVFLAVWTVAYEAIVLERELAIRLESARTGTPIATIVAQQTAASGMWAAGEGFQILYLVPLLYLLWPIGFNLASRLFATRSRA